MKIFTALMMMVGLMGWLAVKHYRIQREYFKQEQADIVRQRRMLEILKEMDKSREEAHQAFVDAMHIIINALERNNEKN